MKIDPSLFAGDQQAIDAAYGECPVCAAKLDIKFHGKQAFLACSAYPQCEHTQALHEQGETVITTVQGRHCPQCDGELAVKKGRYGLFIGCLNFPACHYLASPNTKVETKFACPQCQQGHLVERNNKYGKHFYACDQYPKCNFAVNEQPQQGQCQHCGFGLLVQAQHGHLHCADKRCGKTQWDTAQLDAFQQAYTHGHVIAYPTEAVFGLGGDPDNAQVIEQIINLKGRSAAKGLILIAGSVEQILPYIDIDQLTAQQWQNVQAKWPGPFTFVLPKSDYVLPQLSGEFATIAVRVSAHPMVVKLCQQVGKPLISTSANISGSEPARTSAEFAEIFPDYAQHGVFLVDGEVGNASRPSQIIDAQSGKILRK